MNLNNPFETFKHSAFRLEGLPEYKVEGEEVAIVNYKSENLDNLVDKEWDEFVQGKVARGAKIERLRLLSEPLTEYEQFELHAYSGHEDIRFAKRSGLSYVKDFWFFDNKYISDITYAEDGSFISLTTREATKEDLEMFDYWYGVFGNLSNKKN